jgi:hypothetical protein
VRIEWRNLFHLNPLVGKIDSRFKWRNIRKTIWGRFAIAGKPTTQYPASDFCVAVHVRQDQALTRPSKYSLPSLRTSRETK